MTQHPHDHWPRGVTPIGVEDFDRLGLNEQNQLFWDGKRVEVRNRLDLTWLQKTLAIVVSVCAVLGALGGFVTGFNNASIFLCARDIHWLSCPAAPSNGVHP
ncbi:MAG: hypothetical protein U1E70_02640 [Acetobacteraceae bacterium]|nr:hypothetical protein [Pseudomonadota bacterium]